MKLAVTYENEMVGQHFGRTEKFKIFDIEDGKITTSQIIDTNGTGHEALAPIWCSNNAIKMQALCKTTCILVII